MRFWAHIGHDHEAQPLSLTTKLSCITSPMDQVRPKQHIWTSTTFTKLGGWSTGDSWPLPPWNVTILLAHIEAPDQGPPREHRHTY